MLISIWWLYFAAAGGACIGAIALAVCSAAKCGDCELERDRVSVGSPSLGSAPHARVDGLKGHRDIPVVGTAKSRELMLKEYLDRRQDDGLMIQGKDGE